jgi:hypothetical protein
MTKLKEFKNEIYKKYTYQLPSPYSPSCFIATVVYGSASYYKLDYFRKFRDEFLVRTKLGGKLIKLYYRISPRVACFIKRKKTLKSILRYALIEPLYLFFKFIKVV